MTAPVEAHTEGHTGSSTESATAPSKFIMWTGMNQLGGAKAPHKPRRCIVCIRAGKVGHDCPGRNDVLSA